MPGYTNAYQANYLTFFSKIFPKQSIVASCDNCATLNCDNLMIEMTTGSTISSLCIDIRVGHGNRLVNSTAGSRRTRDLSPDVLRLACAVRLW